MRRRVRTDEGEPILAERQSVVEHPFGTIKRAFNQGYLLLKGLRKVMGEMGSTTIAYDLRRLLSWSEPELWWPTYRANEELEGLRPELPSSPNSNGQRSGGISLSRTC